MIEQDIQTYLDTATFALNRAIGLAITAADTKDNFSWLTVLQLQNARDIVVAMHAELDKR